MKVLKQFPLGDLNRIVRKIHSIFKELVNNDNGMTVIMELVINTKFASFRSDLVKKIEAVWFDVNSNNLFNTLLQSIIKAWDFKEFDYLSYLLITNSPFLVQQKCASISLEVYIEVVPSVPY